MVLAVEARRSPRGGDAWTRRPRGGWGAWSGVEDNGNGGDDVTMQLSILQADWGILLQRRALIEVHGRWVRLAAPTNGPFRVQCFCKCDSHGGSPRPFGAGEKEGGGPGGGVPPQRNPPGA